MGCERGKSGRRLSIVVKQKTLASRPKATLVCSIKLCILRSPLDELGDGYLFSAHMVQHLLLRYVTGARGLIGSPGWLPDLILPSRMLLFARRITGPVVALFVFGGVKNN